MKTRRHITTHRLGGISWWHVSNSKKKATHHLEGISWLHVMEGRGHSDLHTGWDLMETCQWPRTLNSSGGNSQTVLDFMVVCKKFKWRPGEAKQLTPCMGFCVTCQWLAWRLTATYTLDGIWWWQVSNFNEGIQQLTPWMGFDDGKSAISMKTYSNSLPGWDLMMASQQFRWRHTATHSLDGRKSVNQMKTE